MTTFSTVSTESTVNHHQTSQYQRVKESNKAFLDQLVSEFGSKIIKEVCAKIPGPMSERFFQGEEALADYADDIRDKIRRVVVDHIIELNQPLMSKLGAHPIQIRSWLSGKSLPELQSLLKSESLNPQEPDLRFALQGYKACAAKNKVFRDSLVDTYTGPVVDSVFQTISATRRLQIDTGCLDLESSYEDLNAACYANAPRHAAGVIPAKEHLASFMRTAKITKFEDATQGVFFVEGMYKGKILTLVVKAPLKPSQEAFGTNVVRALGNKTPDMHVIDSTDDQDITSSIHDLLMTNEEYLSKGNRNIPPKFFVMGCIHGASLENLKSSDLDTTSAAQFYDGVLVDLGRLAASDCLLYNQDRFPTIGMGNLANVMIAKDQTGACTGAVAIDNVAYFSNQQHSR